MIFKQNPRRCNDFSIILRAHQNRDFPCRWLDGTTLFQDCRIDLLITALTKFSMWWFIIFDFDVVGIPPCDEVVVLVIEAKKRLLSVSPRDHGLCRHHVLFPFLLHVHRLGFVFAAAVAAAVVSVFVVEAAV